ncbi:MAG: sigma-70 family RNA polymerase sigma factor [Eubacterium sp.]|nr:sigma-70 family RNA polymerase sigma factor [Eubacterium sp.]
MSIEELLEYVKQAKAGDRSAFEKIYVSTYKEAYSIVYSIIDDKDSVEDVVHDIYIKVIVSIPKLNNEKSFKSWFKRIVVNTSKDFLLKKKPALFSSYDSNDGFEEDFDQRLVDEQSLSEPITSKPEIEEMSKRILQAISKLPKEQQICVMMHYYSEMTVDEIAEELGISRNTVLSRLSYARKKLKKELKDDRDNELFGIALFPFVQSIEIAPEVTAVEVSGELLTQLMASAEAETLFAVSQAGFLAKIAELALLQKIMLIISAVAVVGGAAAFIISNQINGEASVINTAQTEPITQASVDITVNEKETVTYSGGNLLLHLNGYMYFSDNGGIYRTNGSIAKREKIADGSANNFVTDGKNVYFISDGLIYQYNAEDNAIIQSKNSKSDYIAYSGEYLYSINVNDKTVNKINASLGEAAVKPIDGKHISFFNNSLSYYRQSDMYYMSFSNGALNEKRVIDGSTLQGMKLNSQITDGKVYYPDFDSDEKGVINVKSTGGALFYSIKLKRGFVDFGICKDKVLYCATDGKLYTADLNGENDTFISDGEYSVTSCSNPFALCYNSKNNTSVLINVENGELTTLSSGYVREFEYDSGVVFYKLNGDSFIKEL